MIDPGTRVRLKPKAGRDPWDAMLAGRTGVVERVEETMEGETQLAVALDDDPARDLGPSRPGRHFFFAPDELEPVRAPRVLVAGIGNMFLGDDGFGCAVAQALSDTPLPEGVEVCDFGVRGLDLAYALAGYDGVVLVDALPLDDEPGTIAVIEPELDDSDAEIETHGMDPVRVLRLARELRGLPRRTLVVGCRPQTIVDPESEEVLVELSEPVRAAVAEAVPLVRSIAEDVVEDLTKGGVEG